MTYSGYQVQENMHVPTCYPGIVKIHAEQLPPTPSKWKSVKIPEGAVKVDLQHALLTKPGFSDRALPRKDFKVEDLKKLDWPAAKCFSHALGGIACSGARPMVSAKTGYVSGKALLGRVYRVPKDKPWGGTGPREGVWRKAWEFVDELLPDFTAEPMTIDEWLESMPSRRRKILAKAAAKQAKRPWREVYRKFSSFIKVELLPGFDKSKYGLVRLETMLDRLIQGPADETHCIAGKYLKPLTQRLKELWSADKPLFYGSTTPQRLHQWLQSFLVDGAKQYFWCDFSMFDNTHSDDSWDFMEKLYRRAGIDDPLFWRVMEAWRRPTGKIGPFKYRANVMNASGRDDTALANGILNGFATYLSACAAWLEKDLMELTVTDVRKCSGVITLSVCGDDSLGSLPPVSEERMAKWRQDMAANVAMFGFETKLNSSQKLYDAVYLGMRPYPTRGGWFWGKTIGRATYKLGWCLLAPDRDILAHITGVADMHVLCSRHVPILSDLALKIAELRVGMKRTPSDKLMDENKPWEWTLKGQLPYDDLTLQAVADTYTVKSTPGNPQLMDGVIVTIADVRSLIREIQAIKRLPCVLDHWLWQHMILVDDL